jgi:hypothetical protein
MRAGLVLLLVAGAGILVRAQGTASILAVDLGTHLQPIAQLRDGGWVGVSGSLGRLAPRDWTRWDLEGRSSSLRLSVREPTGRCAAPRWLPVASPSARAAVGGAGTPAAAGIAASGSVSLDPVLGVGETSPEWGRIQSAVGIAFEHRARDHGVAAATLARVPMTLDWVYASSRGGRVYSYYVEASKRVPDAGNTPEEDPQGIVRVAVSGWLRATPNGPATAGTRSELYWEPAEAPLPRPILKPLAVLRHGSDQVWVMQGHLGVRDTFALYALGGTVRSLATVDAASC